MEQLIYRLNLPSLSDCLANGVKDQYFNSDLKSYHNGLINPKSFLKKEYQIINNIPLTNIMIWKRIDEIPGLPHTDMANKSLVWAINWIENGYGLMEYWDVDEINSENIKVIHPWDEKNRPENTNYSVYVFETLKPAKWVYFLSPGAYLVNTTQIHRATGFKERYCVSCRSDRWINNFKHLNLDQLKNIKWNSIVDIFRDKIIDTDLLINDEIPNIDNIHNFEQLKKLPKVNKIIELSAK